MGINRIVVLIEGEIIKVGRGKKSMSKLISAILAVLIAVSGLVTPMTSLAAAPAETPSQISMSIGGGAEEGKTAMSFNWVTDLSVDASEIVYSTSPNLDNAITKSASKSTPKEEDIIISRNESGSIYTDSFF